MTIYSSLGVGSGGGGGAAFAPNSTLNEFDDFISSVSDFGGHIVSKLSWQNFSHRITGITSIAGHDGIWATNSSADANTLLLANNSAAPLVLGSGSYSCNWVIKINTLSNVTNRYILYIGLGDGNISEFANGAYFLYSDDVNSGNWVLKTSNSSSFTTQNSSTAATTEWVNLGISVNAAASSVTYNINGVTIGTPNTTNIPTVAIYPQFLLLPTAGSADAVYGDLFYYQRTFTTPR